MIPSTRLQFVVHHPFHFLLRVMQAFRANQGFLLAGSVAYNTLLSVVPMLALILTVLSQVVDQGLLLGTLRDYLGLIAPGKVDALTNQIEVFLSNWRLVGVVGLVVVLFFSSLAFMVLENAMSVIFFHRVQVERRQFWVSVLLPYAYILVLAIGFLLVSIVTGALHGFEQRTLSIFGSNFTAAGPVSVLVYLIGVMGEVLLLTSLYMVMPVGKLALRHALLGGIVATLLWELSRHVLVWYFSTLSLVNVVYGTFTTVIIILLSLEVGAIILLLGAQVIAEYERLDEQEQEESFTTEQQ